MIQINLIKPKWYQRYIHARPLQLEKYLQAGRRMLEFRRELRVAGGAA